MAPPARRTVAATLAALALGGLSACSTGHAATAAGPAATLRLGFFANVTHTVPLVGVREGFYTKALGSTTLKTEVFNAGPAATEALLAGSIDAAYVGPNPAINAFVKTHGSAVRIVAGAASGGAELVVRSSITSVAQLKGRRIADPQLGGTQDIALKYWLHQQGFAEPSSGGGDVTVVPTDNATTLQEFQAGKLDGGWLPEPWASRLVTDGGGHVLVDERSLWPAGQFVTTNLVVSTAFLDKHPDTVRALLTGQLRTVGWVAKNAAAAQSDVNAELKTLTGKSLKPAVLARAFANITVTNDPLASTLKSVEDHAVAVGLLKASPLDGIYDLRLLNAALKAAGEPTVSAGGLGSA